MSRKQMSEQLRGHAPRPTRLALTLAALWVGFTSGAAQAAGDGDTPLSEVVVIGERAQLPGAQGSLGPRSIGPRTAATSDTAALLKDIPGVAAYTGGGVSSLPVIHGLGDDRLRTRVDGMDLISACGNHMNPPLSYIDPNQVGRLQVYGGISPVSLGGDNIGGVILADSPAPRFAEPGQGLLTSGQAGAFYRSNGNARGANLSATVANENLAVTYSGATAQSENYHSAKAFKAAGQAAWGQEWLDGDEVGSTRYKSENQSLGVALRSGQHLAELKLGYQHIPYQGFANQHMDMTDNASHQVNFHYLGKYDWGNLDARVYHEHTRHKMNFDQDKLYWYGATHNVPGMPMDTEGKNTGARLQAEIFLNSRDTLRLGGELQRYRLDDWWDPSGGGMAPNTFWNIRDGQRDRNELFGEWEAAWSSQWQSVLGVRAAQVKTDTGTVQGYNTTMGNYLADSTRFNNANRARTDHNWDLTALARYTPDASQRYEGGYARKTRSPSLYERYTWSTGGMAMAMNNWVGDGNGYVGNLDLRPEVAHNLSVTADWHDPEGSWGVKVTPFYSYVHDYIDARCLAASCATGKFVNLTLANQNARLYGVDISGFMPLGKTDFGSFTGRGLLGYVNGRNQSTGDNLYNVMPINVKLSVEHRLGSWTNTVEEVIVGGKRNLSAVHNEIPTAGYALLNLRSSYQWNKLRVDLGIENALNRQYALPLGGAYIGQGTTMSLNGAGAPWGVVVPGMGRAFYAGVNYQF